MLGLCQFPPVAESTREHQENIHKIYPKVIGNFNFTRKIDVVNASRYLLKFVGIALPGHHMA